MPADVELPVVTLANVPVEQAIRTPPQPPPPSVINKPQQVFISSASELYEVCTRILYESISWARNIPTFSQLPLDDQALLLEYSWSEVFLLSLAQLDIPLSMETMIKLTYQNKKYYEHNKKSEIDKETEVQDTQSHFYRIRMRQSHRSIQTRYIK